MITVTIKDMKNKLYPRMQCVDALMLAPTASQLPGYFSAGAPLGNAFKMSTQIGRLSPSF